MSLWEVMAKVIQEEKEQIFRELAKADSSNPGELVKLSGRAQTISRLEIRVLHSKINPQEGIGPEQKIAIPKSSNSTITNPARGFAG